MYLYLIVTFCYTIPLVNYQNGFIYLKCFWYSISETKNKSLHYILTVTICDVVRWHLELEISVSGINEY
jgi:hypothetical protein